MKEEFYDELVLLDDIKVKKDEVVTSSINISATFKYVVEVTSIASLGKLFGLIKKYKMSYYILGEVSNILFLKEYYDCLGVRTKIDFKNNNIVPSYKKISLINSKLIKDNIDSLLFLAMVPGSLGGAIFMNAGAMGKEMKDIIRRVYFYDINEDKIKSFSNKQCEFGYRDSYFKRHEVIILGASIVKKYKNMHEIKKEYKNIVNKRVSKIPYELPSLGSIFKNFNDISVGKLIDDLGLKGFRKNDACVSYKHANVIVNMGYSSGKDVMDLIKIIKSKVKEKYKRELELEIITFE